MDACGDRFRIRTLVHLNLQVALGLVCVGVAGRAADAGQGPQVAPTTQAVSGSQGGWLRVSANRVNIRSRPDVNSLAVARVGRDAVLRWIDAEFGWYRVLPPEGTFSYVSAEYVDRRGEAEGVVSTRSGALRVRMGSLLRDVDPAQSEVPARLARGTRVTIVGEQGGWLKITPPEGVYMYVSGDHVDRISEQVADRLRSVSSRPAIAASRPGGERPTTRPAQGPDLSGRWGRELVSLEKAIGVEASKPMAEQQWDGIIARLRPIVQQREEPMVSRLAHAWSVQLQQRAADQRALQQAEEVKRRLARERAQHEREMERIERLRRQATSQPASDAEGELLRSYAMRGKKGQRWYKLQNPLTQSLVAYIEMDPATGLDPERFIGKYVGVRGVRRFEASVGANVVRAREITILGRRTPTTRPTRRTR